MMLAMRPGSANAPTPAAAGSAAHNHGTDQCIHDLMETID